jgi:histidinol-phosphate/aromatic aminotransferase/cobyric acid decarboxylase-like protein
VQESATVRQRREPLGLDEYDAAAKFAYNENPSDASESVMEAMMTALKYDNRYGLPGWRSGAVPGPARRKA